MRAVHSIGDVAIGELGGHLFLGRNGNGLVQLGEEKANLDTVVPGLIDVVVREDTSRLGLKGSDGLSGQSGVDIGIEDLCAIDS